MAKSLEQIKSSLKLRTTAREGALSLRLGTRKYTLPFEVRLLQSDEFVFVHIPPTAEVMKIVDGKLEMVTDAETGEKAAASFRKSRKGTGRRSSKTSEIPDEIASALSKIPSGFKLGYDADGNPKLIKTRRRS